MAEDVIKERNTCRVCLKKDLEPIISLGEQYVVNFLESVEQNSIKVKLDLVLCNKKDGGCGLLQLKHTVPGNLLYQKFWYKSGINQSMIDSLKDIVNGIEKRIDLNPDDIVLDIGAGERIVGIEILEASSHVDLDKILPIQHEGIKTSV